MAGSLWISPEGTRRKGTSFHELKDLFLEEIGTRHIFEPLMCANENDTAAEVLVDMRYHKFDVIGITDRHKKVVGFARQTDLKDGTATEALRNFDLSLLVTDSTSIWQLVRLFKHTPFLFVIHGNEVNGIVTISDVNKPVVRLYFFGLISLFEMHLNFWIEHYYSHDQWRQLLTPARLQKAENYLHLRTKENVNLGLEDCLQMCDKREILSQNARFLSRFKIRNEDFVRDLEEVEAIRNNLAHSQEVLVESENIDKVLRTLTFLETFLEKSDSLVVETNKTEN